ncbi:MULTISPECIES: EAL domain-containing protein [Sutcliffiella]|uniref:Diguanylate phosphodiesterase n=1 Tax=Sutcliffiella cohnii TaxID=33932 RepID=A0A223KQC3_9BACI|nr:MULTISPECIES: EAL domain-containing protein [Sutcliffiella]AST91577.1 diguanylate phosphodiesterase [Sutcliffiella cohnii]WBL17409.1 EAL domain-containing protein [Sutcliffiella sp. NC1]
MDPLDIIGNIDDVFPYYQAIFSADKQEVIGYEVLGRIHLNEELKSLGGFFLDKTVPDEFKQEVDLVIIEKALKKIVSTGENTLLFINQHAEILLDDKEEKILKLLLQYEEKGLSLHNIVLEIAGTETLTDKDSFINLIQYYKTYGIKIAVTKISGTHLSFLAKLEPTILKIDVKILRESYEMSTHEDVLHSISVLARKMGSTLLYENMEASFQLQYAWRNGGRYYQGYYLHKPSATLVEKQYAKEKLKGKFHEFIRYEKRKLEAIQRLTEELQEKVQTYLTQLRPGAELDEWLLGLVTPFHKQSFRMYICDEDGFQLSSNIVNLDGKWLAQQHYLNKNWSWRPYFLENIMKMRVDRKGILSDVYNDIETKEPIRTFSYPITRNLYLYVDLSYEYLYEINDLL